MPEPKLPKRFTDKLYGEPAPDSFRDNGCGCWLTWWLVPDFCFHEACRRHDYAYSKIRSFWTASRRKADSDLQKNIVMLSTWYAEHDRYKGFLLHARIAAAYVIARIYFRCVRLFGGRAAR